MSTTISNVQHCPAQQAQLDAARKFGREVFAWAVEYSTTAVVVYAANAEGAETVAQAALLPRLAGLMSESPSVYMVPS